MPEPAGPADVVVGTVRPDEKGWAAYVGLFADYRAHYGAGEPEPGASDRWLRTHEATGRVRCYLARAPEPVAMAVVVVSPASLRLGVFWQLRDLWVARDARRRGVGRAVVTSVATDARADGALRLALQTESSNAAAQALYHRLGFEDVTGYVQMMLTL
ncbi:MAG TPA: GNAT family N-acetyltransferase [Actinomycetes bacterium]|jgi:ribosomal protein S18 acetylase RimI-like enzyme|nr:GNAT family N-acetyltransferase [Actinomycetes bacterium]